MGFEGLLMSDDLDMKALSGTLADRAAAVLQAGCDIALNCWGRLDDMEAIANRVAPMSELSLSRLARACAHVSVTADTPALRQRIEALLDYRDARNPCDLSFAADLALSVRPQLMWCAVGAFWGALPQ